MFRIILEIKPEVTKLLKGIVNCKETGIYLLDLILDSKINPILLSSFVGALSLFGQENMGKIEEISVKGIDVELIIVSKHDLILIVLMDRHFYKDIVRRSGEKILDLFYAMYSNQLEDSEHIDRFKGFKDVLFSEIQACLDKMKELDKKRDILKKGLEYND